MKYHCTVQVTCFFLTSKYKYIICPLNPSVTLCKNESTTVVISPHND